MRQVSRIDGLYTYHVTFRAGGRSNMSLNCLDGVAYRSWLRHFMRTYPVVEIYHGESSFDFPFEQHYPNVLYFDELNQKWKGRAWSVRHNAMLGRELKGSFLQVFNDILAYSGAGNLRVIVHQKTFEIELSDASIMALVLRESDTFQRYMC